VRPVRPLNKPPAQGVIVRQGLYWRSTVTRLILVASAASLLGLAPALAQTTQGSAAAQSSAQISSQDRTFVQTAAQSNLAEIQAGQLAETRGATPAVREFGRWMVTDHTSMNNMLRTIAEHEGVTMPTSPNPTQMQQATQLQSAHGQAFDRAYISAQVLDHEQALAAFRQETSAGQNMPLKKLAQTGVPVMEQHLTEARELQQASGHPVANATPHEAGAASNTSR
jgi:putative membrane protein